MAARASTRRRCDYLVANQGNATWIVAVSDSTTASQIELSTGRAVMSMGGFTGSDNALTLDRLEAYVASGELRFVEIGGRGGGWRAGWLDRVELGARRRARRSASAGPRRRCTTAPRQSTGG